MGASDRQSELATNARAFKDLLPDLYRTHPGRRALMHHGRVEGIFDTIDAAVAHGIAAHPDWMFSVEKIVLTPTRYYGGLRPADPHCFD